MSIQRHYKKTVLTYQKWSYKLQQPRSGNWNAFTKPLGYVLHAMHLKEASLKFIASSKFTVMHNGLILD